MNLHNLVWIFVANNGIIYVMYLIFSLKINLGNKYKQFKEKFNYTCFPKSRGRTKLNYVTEIVCWFLF